MRIDCLVQNKRVVSLYYEPLKPAPVSVRVKDRGVFKKRPKINIYFSIEDDLKQFESFDFEFDNYGEVDKLIKKILEGSYEKK